MESIRKGLADPILRRIRNVGDFIVLIVQAQRAETGYDAAAYFFRVIYRNPLSTLITDSNSVTAGNTLGPNILTPTGIGSGQSVLAIPMTLPYNIYHIAVALTDNSDNTDPNLKLGIYYPAQQQINGISTETPPKDDLSEPTAGIPSPYTITDIAKSASLTPLLVPSVVTEQIIVPGPTIQFAVRNNTAAAVTPRYRILGAMYLIQVIKDPLLQEKILRHNPYIVPFGSWRPTTINFPPDWGEPRPLTHILDRIDVEVPLLQR